MKKISSIFMASMLSVGLLLTGCGAGGTSNATAPATPAPATTETKPDTNTASSGSITAVGSTAMQPLVEQVAKKFMEKNQQVQIQVQGGGSGTGLSQVANGAATIGNSDIFAEEKKGIPADQLVDYKIAVVGMAAVIHPKAGVDNLTKQQVIDIFTGKVTNWKEVGGTDQKITLVNRPKNSGTRATFVQYALDGAEEAEGITEDSSGTVRKIIAETPGAIGYLGTSYLNDTVKAVKLDGVEATTENIVTNKYKVWAYQHMYTKGEPTGAQKDFLDFMTSDEVQTGIVQELKYIPASAMKVERTAKGEITQK
ncbi:phosphate ABC transporter substrate-binding protein [Brevibacillus halotolerans]|uniref:phosphate ABC transporter substrate-binding protein n=1 Tax=Brevibacillus halotolerans TaxID=1507437 RepID=UPI0015EFA80A|nr:phosphate ABC transporter substrate-binding protein [Brevibacillus halotolerans]MBA4534856.1 phosphate ABC transporter substrate-binding protein [Brevibacillus halotolerans]